MFYGFRAVRLARESSLWPSTPATILTSNLVHHSGKHGGSWEPSITYRYTVGWQEYTGTTIIPGVSAYNGASSRLVDQFPSGTPQSVYVSPADPNQAFLIKGLHPYNFEQFALGALCLAFSLLLGIPNLGTLLNGGYSSGSRELGKVGCLIALLFLVQLIVTFGLFYTL